MSRRSVWPRAPLLAAAVCLGIALGLALAAGPARAQPAEDAPHLQGRPNPMRAPGPLSAPGTPLGVRTATDYHTVLAEPIGGPGQPLFLGLLNFYRTVISPVNGDQSDLAPVHSLYGVQAIKRHGALLGTVLTTERLIHEPSEIPHAPAFTEHGRTFHYDPLEANTYWLPAWLGGLE